MTPRRLVIGGLALLTVGLGGLGGSPAQAQFGWGNGMYNPYPMGWGSGGGWGGGWGGGMAGWGTGMTLYDQEVAKTMAANQAVAQFNLTNAQTMSTMQESRLREQQVISQAMANQERYLQLRAQNDPKNRSQNSGAPNPSNAKLNGLFNADGNLNWPAAAPGGGLLQFRRRADTAFRSVRGSQSLNQSVPVRTLVDAKKSLYTYGRAALLQLQENPEQHDELKKFLVQAEEVLNELANS